MAPQCGLHRARLEEAAVAGLVGDFDAFEVGGEDDGVIADVAPTLLALLGQKPPEEMAGVSLVR